MRGDYVEIEILGLYWHFVDLVWVFIFAFFFIYGNLNYGRDKKKKNKQATHKIGIYLWIWGLLFVLSFFSYMVDWYQFQGILDGV